MLMHFWGKVTWGYPAYFHFLRPLASRCDVIGNDDDCRRFLESIDDLQCQQFVDMYVKLVSHSDKPRSGYRIRMSR